MKLSLKACDKQLTYEALPEVVEEADEGLDGRLLGILLEPSSK